ncbi:hypothetical protein ACS0TY_022195 [Phlomoides rotata]
MGVDLQCVLCHNAMETLYKGKKGKVFAGCIWECVVWTIWKGRNGLIFRNEAVEQGKILDEIISRLWSWFEVCGQRGRTT